MAADTRVRPQPAWRNGARFLVFVTQRFFADQCTVRAAGLTYTSLLALVPLLATSFAIFSAFPAFEALETRVQTYIFANFVPEVGETVLDYLESFTAQTGRLTAVGTIFLVVTSVMLLLTINDAFDAVWRVGESRALMARLLVYWAVLSLAPLLVGASVSLSGYLFAMAQATGVEKVTGPLIELARFLPLLLQFGAFTLLFLLMPNFPVRWRDAVIGGFTSALLFEILKKLFGLYVASVPTYEMIYGALATAPIFLIWVYIAWIVLLVGAEITAALPEWRAGRRDPSLRHAEQPALALVAALGILHALLVASQRGVGLPLRALIRSVTIGPELLDATLRRLRDANFIARDDRGEWRLARDLAVTSLAELGTTLGLDPQMPRSLAGEHQPWNRRYRAVVARVAESNAEIMATDLRRLLSPEGDPDEEIAELLEEDTAEDEETPASKRARLLAWITLGWLGTS